MQQPQQHPAHQHGKYQHPQIQYLMKPEYNGENISICLQNRDLWKRFHDLTNEMIVTKAGRRMFPIVSISIRGLEPEKMYSVELSFEQIDPHRWRYVSGQWQPGTKPDPLLPRTPYQHPDSPNYGETWMRDTVVFSKVKLTNKTNQTGFQTKLDPYPTSSTSPFDPSLFYTPTTPASIPCSSSSPISPNTAAAAAYYSNTYYPTPTSYYFPYGTTPSPASHHPFMAPLTCPMNNGTSSSPLSPSFLHLQQPVTILPNVNNHSTSSSPKDHENLFNSSTTQTAANDVGQY
ncbi:unnamed protein product [Rotaria magnacalcarata]|uniref:T-box domain-containing protein n=1 Tax=Rotaria magnacalcarata TaxID=392030 RepID=A0A8S2L7X1_9BILA|nr:unnamed protein product [Rotaria magnacalcarata]CAF3924613.1 unnamed protein product [Rotaria magnacalcarata]